MKIHTIIGVLLIIQTFAVAGSFAQTDSVWSVLLLKKGKNPEMKENMAVYSPTGFFLYRNCFYDIQLRKSKRQTIRLIDIKQDTLIFIGVSAKRDTNPSLTSTDTVVIDYRDIEQFHLVRDWSSGNGKKIKCDSHYFLFEKSTINHRLDSKYDNVFAEGNTSELVPRVSAHGVTYHFEYNGRLYYHSGIRVQTPKYTDEEKAAMLNRLTKILDLIINKRVIISVP